MPVLLRPNSLASILSNVKKRNEGGTNEEETRVRWGERCTGFRSGLVVSEK